MAGIGSDTPEAREAFIDATMTVLPRSAIVNVVDVTAVDNADMAAGASITFTVKLVNPPPDITTASIVEMLLSESNAEKVAAALSQRLSNVCESPAHPRRDSVGSEESNRYSDGLDDIYTTHSREFWPESVAFVGFNPALKNFEQEEDFIPPPNQLTAAPGSGDGGNSNAAVVGGGNGEGERLLTPRAEYVRRSNNSSVDGSQQQRQLEEFEHSAADDTSSEFQPI